jgi:alpha-2-macroglobulin
MVPLGRPLEFRAGQIVETRRRGKIDLSANAPAKISAIVGLGEYRLDVTSGKDGDLPTSLTFESGWSGEAGAPTPDLLDVTPDKANYKPGEEMRLRIGSRFAGSATIAIVSERLAYMTTLELKEGDTVKTVPVSGDRGAGAYALVLAHRPLDKSANRMPGRAIGLAWFAIDADAHALDVKLGTPAKTRPRGVLTIPLEIKGISSGEEARVTVAAIDAGILNLTHYEAPDPRAYFFGQRQLSAEIRDLYGQSDRRHAGNARRDTLRRRRHPGAWWRAANAGAARAFFGNCQDRPRWKSADRFQPSRFQRHLARDGGRLDKDESR